MGECFWTLGGPQIVQHNQNPLGVGNWESKITLRPEVKCGSKARKQNAQKLEVKSCQRSKAGKRSPSTHVAPLEAFLLRELATVFPTTLKMNS